jgi:hypothetical protein
MMGKSRVVPEATRPRDTDVVEALGRASLGVDQLRQLEVPGRDIIVIVNDPDVEQAQGLAEAVLERDGLKLILFPEAHIRHRTATAAQTKPCAHNLGP